MPARRFDPAVCRCLATALLAGAGLGSALAMARAGCLGFGGLAGSWDGWLAAAVVGSGLGCGAVGRRWPRGPLLLATVAAAGLAALALLQALGGAAAALASSCGCLLVASVLCGAAAGSGAQAALAGLALAVSLASDGGAATGLATVGLCLGAGALLAGRRIGSSGPAGWPAAALLVLGLAAPATAVAWAWPRWPAPLPAAAVGAALLAGAAAAAGAPRWWWLGGGLGAVLLGVAAGPVAAVEPRLRELARDGGAVAVYDRSHQELQLQVGGVVVDAHGPDAPHAELLAVLLAAAAAPADRVLLLGEGAGRLPAAVAAAGFAAVDGIATRPAAAPVRARLQGVGPVAAPAEPAAAGRWWRGPAGAVLARLPAGARQALVVAEPLHRLAVGQATVAQQAELRRVVGAGVVLQPFRLDRSPAADLEALCAAASVAHPWNAVFAVGELGVLLSAGAPLRWPAAAAFTAWPWPRRWLAHRVHLGEAEDLQRCCLGVLVDPGRDAAGAPLAASGRVAAIAVLHRWLQPVPVPPPSDGSVLLRWQALQAELRAAEQAVQRLGSGPGAAAAAQEQALRFWHLGAPSPWLQAAAGLPAADGISLLAPELASRRAHALDPLWHTTPAPVFGDLPRPRQVAGELEDLASLPEPGRLAELCQGEAPLAVALRARFPSACAEALVAALARGPLEPAAQQALREVADPFVLAAAGAAIEPRGGTVELLGLWRGDLPLPAALRSLLRGAPAEQCRLAAALAGRRDADAREALAELLVAPEREVRVVAGRALHVTSSRIDYDPDGPPSGWQTAATRLRELHNRAP